MKKCTSVGLLISVILFSAIQHVMAQERLQNGASLSCDIVIGGDDGLTGKELFAPGVQMSLQILGSFMCRGNHNLPQGQFVRYYMDLWTSPTFREDPVVRQAVLDQFDYCGKLAVLAYNDPRKYTLHVEMGNVDIETVGSEFGADIPKMSVRYSPTSNTLRCYLGKNLTGLE